MGGLKYLFLNNQLVRPRQQCGITHDNTKQSKKSRINSLNKLLNPIDNGRRFSASPNSNFEHVEIENVGNFDSKRRRSRELPEQGAGAVIDNQEIYCSKLRMEYVNDFFYADFGADKEEDTNVCFAKPHKAKKNKLQHKRIKSSVVELTKPNKIPKPDIIERLLIKSPKNENPFNQIYIKKNKESDSHKQSSIEVQRVVIKKKKNIKSHLVLTPTQQNTHNRIMGIMEKSSKEQINPSLKKNKKTNSFNALNDSSDAANIRTFSSPIVESYNEDEENRKVQICRRPFTIPKNNVINDYPAMVIIPQKCEICSCESIDIAPTAKITVNKKEESNWDENDEQKEVVRSYSNREEGEISNIISILRKQSSSGKLCPKIINLIKRKSNEITNERYKTPQVKRRLNPNSLKLNKSLLLDDTKDLRLTISNENLINELKASGCDKERNIINKRDSKNSNKAIIRIITNNNTEKLNKEYNISYNNLDNPESNFEKESLSIIKDIKDTNNEDIKTDTKDIEIAKNTETDNLGNNKITKTDNVDAGKTKQPDEIADNDKTPKNIRDDTKITKRFSNTTFKSITKFESSIIKSNGKDSNKLLNQSLAMSRIEKLRSKHNKLDTAKNINRIKALSLSPISPELMKMIDSFDFLEPEAKITISTDAFIYKKIKPSIKQMLKSLKYLSERSFDPTSVFDVSSDNSSIYRIDESYLLYQNIMLTFIQLKFYFKDFKQKEIVKYQIDDVKYGLEEIYRAAKEIIMSKKHGMRKLVYNTINRKMTIKTNWYNTNHHLIFDEFVEDRVGSKILIVKKKIYAYADIYKFSEDDKKKLKKDKDHINKSSKNLLENIDIIKNVNYRFVTISDSIMEDSAPEQIQAPTKNVSMHQILSEAKRMRNTIRNELITKKDDYFNLMSKGSFDFERFKKKIVVKMSNTTRVEFKATVTNVKEADLNWSVSDDSDPDLLETEELERMINKYFVRDEDLNILKTILPLGDYYLKLPRLQPMKIQKFFPSEIASLDIELWQKYLLKVMSYEQFIASQGYNEEANSTLNMWNSFKASLKIVEAVSLSTTNQNYVVNMEKINFPFIVSGYEKTLTNGNGRRWPFDNKKLDLNDDTDDLSENNLINGNSYMRSMFSPEKKRTPKRKKSSKKCLPLLKLNEIAKLTSLLELVHSFYKKSKTANSTCNFNIQRHKMISDKTVVPEHLSLIPEIITEKKEILSEADRSKSDSVDFHININDASNDDNEDDDKEQKYEQPDAEILEHRCNTIDCLSPNNMSPIRCAGTSKDKKTLIKEDQVAVYNNFEEPVISTNDYTTQIMKRHSGRLVQLQTPKPILKGKVMKSGSQRCMVKYNMMTNEKSKFKRKMQAKNQIKKQSRSVSPTLLLYNAIKCIQVYDVKFYYRIGGMYYKQVFKYTIELQRS